ncbi:ankyrin [Acephala macrosclerotiorum]|nr:ankyrin [Acephala macrosclerotiorum]
MAIHCAASTSEINTWKFIQAGADPRAQANDSRNALHFAAIAAKSNVVGLLCRLYRENCWAVDLKDETGRTPLHYATCSGNSESVFYLLQSGANPNVRDKRGMTPLHACAEHNVNTTQLRNQRKDEEPPHYRDVPSGMERLGIFMDTRKESPIHGVQWNLRLAIGNEKEARSVRDVARLLLSAGADPAIRSKSGQTAYDVAILLGSEEAAEVLSLIRQRADVQHLLADQWYSIRRTAREMIVESTDIENADAYTTLQTAISFGNEALFDSLLSAGVDPTVLGPEGLTPVHTIAHWGLVSMMKVLARHVKDLNIFSPPLLHVATTREQSNIQIFELLIESGINVNTSYKEVNDSRRRSTGDPIPSYTAAHILAMGEQWWNISALESLCKAGADLELTDADGNTALQCALNGKKSGSWRPGFWRDETLEVILRHGANINALSPENGSTPLIAALEAGRNSKLIQRLLDYGADITLGRRPAIFAAIESEDPESVAAVVDAGANVNAIYHPETPKKWGRGPKVETPLLSAAVKDGLAIREPKSRIAREAIMTVLLQHGADPTMKLQDGKSTVIHQIATFHGLISPILKSGVGLEIKDSKNRTPLILACSPLHNSARVMEDESTPSELILAGSNVHATDKDGSTPLHLAAQAELVKTVALLLENGATASAKNRSGLTPLYYALSSPYYHKKLDLARPLVSVGADPLFRGPNGETALHLLAPDLVYLSPADGAEFRERNHGRKVQIDLLAEFKVLYQRLVDEGCERNALDNLGNTPLFPYVKRVKARSDYIRIDPPAEKDVRQMFDEHDVLAVNHEGDTLLHAVAGRQEEDGTEPDGVWLFKELMARGVDPRGRNKKGISALDVAAACGKQAILGLFAREE